jgi:hypothetical protein
VAFGLFGVVMALLSYSDRRPSVIIAPAGNADNDESRSAQPRKQDRERKKPDR